MEPEQEVQRGEIPDLFQMRHGFKWGEIFRYGYRIVWSLILPRFAKNWWFPELHFESSTELILEFFID